MGFTRTLRVISGAMLTGALVLASAPNATADQVRDSQWALKSLDAESIWKITKGKGETVALIDDGVNAGHPDLRGNVLKGKDFIDGGSTSPESNDAHGTAMAGIIAAHGHGSGNGDGVIGLAPEAEILPLRDQGSRNDGYAASIRYAVDHGASVINISQGQARPRARSEEQEAVAYALKHNVPVVAATGNGEGKVGYPASYPGVVAVGAVTERGEAWEDSDPGKAIMLNAPGTKLPHAGGPKGADGYGLANGTSYSTAYVSAAIALVRGENPDLTAGQIVNRLTKTAEMPASEKGTTLPDEQYGYGAIRPLAALQEDVPKGSKYGPLSVPQSLKDDAEIAEKERESKAQQAQSDKEAVILWIITGVIGVLFVGGIVLTIVLVRRRKRKRNNGPGPGADVGYTYPLGHASSQQQNHVQQPPYN